MKVMTPEDELLARQAISLLELVVANPDDTAQRVIGLCRRATTPMGPVAAVSVFPRFVGVAALALHELNARDVRVVALVNFPHGGSNIEAVISETQMALLAGADEIDVVYPFRALLGGDRQTGIDLVKACKTACGRRAALTVTLETGDLRDPQIIRNACEGAIAAGADFLKTSTGKVVTNATPQAARILLETIADVGGQIGFKAAGGIRSFEQARVYLELARARFGPQWVNAQRVRIAGSSLLDELLVQLGVLGMD
jgi:deoxyribose-phosphate aldolase